MLATCPLSLWAARVDDKQHLIFSPLVLIDMTLDSDTYPMSLHSTLGVDLTLSLNSSINLASMYNNLQLYLISEQAQKV